MTPPPLPARILFQGYVLNEVFDRLKDACDVVESVSGKFAHSDKFGYVTSCPTNLGTGMRASIHIKVMIHSSIDLFH